MGAYQSAINAYQPYTTIGQAGMQSLAQALGVNVDPNALPYGGGSMGDPGSAVPRSSALATALTMNRRSPQAVVEPPMVEPYRQPPVPPMRSDPAGSMRRRSSYAAR